MTAINASYMPLVFSGNGSASSSNQHNTQQNSSYSSMSAGAYSLSLSDAALSALQGNGIPDSDSGIGITALAFNPVDTFSMSYTALSPTAGGEATGFEAMFSISGASAVSSGSGSLSQIFSDLQQLVTNVDNILDGSGQNGTSEGSAQSMETALDASAPGSASFAEAELADGGPLPAFLAQVDAQMHLSTTQQQALQNIATENMNATDTPQTIQTIATELQQANI